MGDLELEAYCANNPDCGCDCMRCPAFAKNALYNLGR